jgi:hypothetical protein
MKYKNKNTEHPENGELAGFIDHTLESGEKKQIEEHLLSCAECRSIVMESIVVKSGKKGGRRVRIAVYLATAASLIWAMMILLPN